MAVDWIAKRNMASAGISKWGQVVTIERPGVPGGTLYAPTPGVPETFQMKAYDMGMVAETQPGTLVPMMQRTLLAEVAGSPAPAAEDRIQIAGKWHEISTVEAFSPAGTDLFYTIKLVG